MSWPRLSKTLPGERDPRKCQVCAKDYDVYRWQEHDEHDQPENIIVVLCDRCAYVVKPHPRLYRQLDTWEPFPGSNTMCHDCRLREATRCTHPDLKANGGEGLTLNVPKPLQAFICPGGLRHIWQGEPTCTGRELNDGP